MDLANAHTKSMEYAIASKDDSNYEVFNLGIGEGVTVLEAINAFEKVTGKKLNYKISERREGDVIAIYANNQHAAQKLAAKTKYRRYYENRLGMGTPPISNALFIRLTLKTANLDDYHQISCE